MKRIIVLSFLAFSVSGNIFAQSKPVETFRNFWSMALSNNVESAQEFVESPAQSQEFKYRQIRNSFQEISQNKLQFPEHYISTIFPESAYFIFQIELENKKKFKGQVLLINQNRDWKILLFDVRPENEIDSKTQPDTKMPPIFKPQLIPNILVTKKCLICG